MINPGKQKRRSSTTREIACATTYKRLMLNNIQKLRANEINKSISRLISNRGAPSSTSARAGLSRRNQASSSTLARAGSSRRNQASPSHRARAGPSRNQSTSRTYKKCNNPGGGLCSIYSAFGAAYPHHAPWERGSASQDTHVSFMRGKVNLFDKDTKDTSVARKDVLHLISNPLTYMKAGGISKNVANPRWLLQQSKEMVKNLSTH